MTMTAAMSRADGNLDIRLVYGEIPSGQAGDPQTRVAAHWVTDSRDQR
jgi:hypothetical protein